MTICAVLCFWAGMIVLYLLASKATEQAGSCAGTMGIVVFVLFVLAMLVVIAALPPIAGG